MMSIIGTRLKGRTNINIGFIFTSTLIFLFILLSNSCKKDADFLGRNLLPSSDNLNLVVDSSTLVRAYTSTGVRRPTSTNDLYLLGSLKDSVFGTSSASILTQFYPLVLKSVDSTRTVDSLVIYLASAGYYGDSASQMNLKIYELNEKLRLDTTYFSDLNPADYSDMATEIASTSYVVGDTLVHFSVTDPDFIAKFATLPDSVFQDVVDFQNEFKGLYIRVDPVSQKGGFSYFDMTLFRSSGMVLYANGDSVGYEMAFSSFAAKANAFTHDYSGSPVSVNLDKPEAGDSLIFLEGLAGTNSIISFPELEKWKEKGNISINKAELIIPVDSLEYPGLTRDNYPPILSLFTLDDDSSYHFMYDYRVDLTGKYFDGTFDGAIYSYVFNIGLHLQSYLRGDIENSRLLLLPTATNTSANRVIVRNGNVSSKPMKLKVVYTELY
ncbi:MAG: DUF4270 family protein [Bacteroidales bacterium]|nr:DUF4270 family protein [Bacteroidales bacterium]